MALKCRHSTYKYQWHIIPTMVGCRLCTCCKCHALPKPTLSCPITNSVNSPRLVVVRVKLSLCPRSNGLVAALFNCCRPLLPLLPLKSTYTFASVPPLRTSLVCVTTYSRNMQVAGRHFGRHLVTARQQQDAKRHLCIPTSTSRHGSALIRRPYMHSLMRWYGSWSLKISSILILL